MKRDAYRNGKIPGRRGYGLDDDELVRLFDSGLKIIEIAGKMGISQWTVLAHLRKLGLRRNKRHHITRPDAFSTCSAGSCYWAGFLAADGCVSSENEVDVELGIVDAEHLRTLCGFVGRDETLWFRKRERMRKGKPRIFEYASVGLRSARIVEDLRTNFKVVPRKSLVLEPPDVPQPMLRHFIRGI